MAIACVEKGHSLAEREAMWLRLPLRERLVILRRLAEHVQRLHEQGVIHGRIRPQSIRIDEAFRPHISQPPLRRTFGPQETDCEVCPPELHLMTRLELPSDLAAAAWLLHRAGHRLDPRRIDVYQLGALLCRLVTGRALRDYILSPTVKNLVPPPIRHVLARAVGFDAADCYPDCEALIRGLDEALLSAESASRESRIAETQTLESSGTRAAGLPRPQLIARSRDRLPFQRLGHFEILERIGGGSMGDVYKGYDESLRRVVAIKVLPPELAHSASLIERFRREAAATANVDHPNLLSVYFAGEDGGHHFFAMPYVAGRSLAEWLDSTSPPTRDEALEVAEQCLSALEAARPHAIVHRDIKPANILVEAATGRVLLIDFGLVRWSDGAASLTAPGTLMGTADFMAPEQTRGAPIDHRADLYALGVLLYRLLAGRLPFSGETAAAVMYQHTYEPAPPLRQLVPGLPQPLIRIVERLLEKDPRCRYPTAGQVLKDLQDFRRADPAEAAASAVAPRIANKNGPRFPVRSRKLWWACAGLAVAITWLAIWALSPQLGTKVTIENPAPISSAVTRWPPPWIDAIQTPDLTRHAVSGDWQREQTDLITGPQPYSRLLLPVKLDHSYDLTAEFSRIDGDGPVGLLLPVGSRTCMIQLGAPSIHGLERIDGLLVDHPFNPSRRPGLLINGRRYRLEVAVRIDGNDATIKACLNGEPVVSWNGRLSSLDVLDVWSLPQPHRPALAANAAIVRFHAVAVRAEPGSAHVVSTPHAPQPDLEDGTWRDLTRGVDVERDTLGGWWLARDGVLSVAPVARDQSFVRLMFPQRLEGDYQLVAQFTRTSGNDSVNIILPVGTRQATLHFGADGGSLGGLEQIDGREIQADHNPAVRRPSPIINGQRYQTLVQVQTDGDGARIEVWLDGNPFLHWQGRVQSLSSAPNWMLPESSRVAIGSNQGTVTFHAVRARILNDLPPDGAPGG